MAKMAAPHELPERAAMDRALNKPLAGVSDHSLSGAGAFDACDAPGAAFRGG